MNKTLTLLFLITASTITPAASRAESCRDYFRNNNIRNEILTEDQKIFISWYGKDFSDCNSNGYADFNCGGKQFAPFATTVYDKNGTPWSIKWKKSSKEVTCLENEDGSFTSTQRTIHQGNVKFANIPVRRLIEVSKTYRIVKPHF